MTGVQTCALPIYSIEEATETFTGEDGASHSTTRYRYFLSNRTTPTAFDPSLGDLEVSNVMRPLEFRHWDPVTATNVSTQAYVVSTTGTRPPGFKMLAEESITAVGLKLEALMADLPSVKEVDLATEAATFGIDLITDTTGYPTLSN